MRIVVYDAAEGGFLGLSWSVGSAVLSGADARIAARSWDDAIGGLGALALRTGPPVDVQVWGHGAPGAPYMAGVALGSRLDAFAARLPKGSTVWWRSCDVHGGAAGHRFAASVAARGLTSVGHCTVISWPNPLTQGEICALRPGETVWWTESGAELRGCGVTRMTVPAWAYGGTG